MTAARASSAAAAARSRAASSATIATTHIDWPATLGAKADNRLQRHHLRWQEQPPAHGVLHCIVLDCSASMLQGSRLARAKGLLLQLSAQCYRQRASITVIGFGGKDARVLQPARRAAAFNDDWISTIGGGGATPVNAAMELATQLLARYRRRQPAHQLQLWLLSDARFHQLPARPALADHCVVVDFDDAPVKLGRAARIAAAWDAELIDATTLSSG